jgi:hypothetical protein
MHGRWESQEMTAHLFSMDSRWCRALCASKTRERALAMMLCGLPSCERLHCYRSRSWKVIVPFEMSKQSKGKEGLAPRAVQKYRSAGWRPPPLLLPPVINNNREMTPVTPPQSNHSTCPLPSFFLHFSIYLQVMLLLTLLSHL